MLGLWLPLLSDNLKLIDWFVNFDEAFDSKRIENHKSDDFWAYQSIVAIRGDWPRLRRRCEDVLGDPPTAKSEKNYLIDHEFFLAFSKGDAHGMEEVLRRLVQPKALAARSNDESGFTSDLISTPAFIYAKIAWRHGYEVDVGSPFVPKQWLPVLPLERCAHHYDFLA